MKNSLTIDDIEGLIVAEEYYTLGRKTTAVCLTLKSGFEVIGISSCVDPTNYDQKVGVPIARARALDQVWMVAGYSLQEKLNADR